MALLDFLSLTPKNIIGGIEVMANLEEIYSDTLQTTEHPVEKGAAITDHAYRRPSEVVLRCGWSNSTLDSLLSSVESLFDGSMSSSDYVASVYSQLLALQQSRIPFDITTSRRQYKNMLMVGLQVTSDQTTGNILMATATCREVIIVSTQATTLPPRENQASPEKTASPENTGVKQPVPATPSPGGAVPPAGM